MNWAPFLIASIPAAAAAVSALLASSSARKTKQFETQAQYVRDLENRLAEKKYKTYQPMIDLLSEMLDPATMTNIDLDEARDKFAQFDAWIVIFGSDGAVEAWHNFRQGSFHDAPPAMLIRLYADFVLAARRDMGHPDTTVSSAQLVGVRIKDLYGDGELGIRSLFSLDLMEIAGRTGWTPPWTISRSSAPEVPPNSPE